MRTIVWIPILVVFLLLPVNRSEGHPHVEPGPTATLVPLGSEDSFGDPLMPDRHDGLKVSPTDLTDIPDNNRARVFMCRYADSGDPPFGIPQIDGLFSGVDDPVTDYQIGIRTALNLATHGTASITEVVYMDWVRMETDYLDYLYTQELPDGSQRQFWNINKLGDDCVKAHGFTHTPPDEEYYILFFPKVGGSRAYGGQTSVLIEGEFYTRRMVFSETIRPSIILHELGHAHGLSHIRNYRNQEYKSRISPVGKGDIVGFTAFELWDISQFSKVGVVELSGPNMDEQSEVVINLQQLHPALGESPHEGVHYAAYIPLDRERPLMENLVPNEEHPPEYLWLENRCADQRYIQDELNVDWFSPVMKCGIRVYIVQNYYPDSDDFHILWSPMNWTYKMDMGIVPLDPQKPYQLYRVENGEADTTITVCAQYPDRDQPLLRKVHVGFNQMCSVPPVPTWEVFLPLMQR